ncbi:MAG: hypothetical protein D6747_05570 [Chlorobiota bacterium]|nr:MAG: hypothetical protein D6747_05570 [Chlorobiota bacterium]
MSNRSSSTAKTSRTFPRWKSGSGSSERLSVAGYTITRVPEKVVRSFRRRACVSAGGQYVQAHRGGKIRALRRGAPTTEQQR